MTPGRTAIIVPCLLGLGLATCVLSARPLLKSAELKTPLNPFGIKRSPYGEVIAMALQGSIDTQFLISVSGTASTSPARLDSPPAPDHVPTSPTSWIQSVLEEMRRGHEVRTNPVLASEALKLFLRRKAEDKLRLAYDLDPSHYTNYNALHFFLAEHISTRPEMIPKAGSLAQETIAYCLARQEDPQALLTAAAAYGNLLQLMFQERADGTRQASIADMEANLNGLDQTIGRYLELSDRWLQTGGWNQLSPQRIEECQERLLYIKGMREIWAKTLARIKNHQVMQNSLKSEERSG